MSRPSLSSIPAVVATLLLSACATSKKPSAPVIVADGTEMKQFENMVMCGNLENFVSSLGAVGKHLGKTWDDTLGKDNQQPCSIRLTVDSEGHIRGREVLACENVTGLDRVLAAADPVPAPKDACLLARLNDIAIEINGSGNGK